MGSNRLLIVAALVACSAVSAAPAGAYLSLESAAGLELHNVEAQPVTLDGKRGLRVTFSADAKRRFRELSPEEQAQFETLALVKGSVFTNGVIEAEIAGAPAVDAPDGARGFVGIAFRVGPELRTYDAFYLRPTNGRAGDQERRNHSTQYVSHPDWPWYRLRKETPSRYESYVDLEPGKWTRIRIEVHGAQALLYVHGQPRPTLIVNDVKSGADGSGAIALWINPGTVAHFRELRISAD
jgi:hypothetical protein